MKRKVTTIGITCITNVSYPIIKIMFEKECFLVNCKIRIIPKVVIWYIYIVLKYLPYKPVSSFEGHPSRISFMFYLVEFWQSVFQCSYVLEQLHLNQIQISSSIFNPCIIQIRQPKFAKSMLIQNLVTNTFLQRRYLQIARIEASIMMCFSERDYHRNYIIWYKFMYVWSHFHTL